MEQYNDQPKLYPSPGEAFAILALTFFLSILFVPFLRLVFGFDPQSKWSLFLTELFMIVPAVMLLRRRGYPLPLVLRLRPVSARVLALSVFIGLALAIIGDEIERLTHLILPLPNELESLFSSELLKDILTAGSIPEWILLIMTLVVIAGLFEEMLFRGMLQNALEERMDITRAVISTAIIFSLIHFNPYWVVPIAILGVFLGVLAWKSQSIFPSAIVHAVNNGLALVANNLSDEKTDMFLWNGHVHPLILLAAGVGLYYGMRLFYRFIEEDTEIPTLLNQPL
ncbi:MAG: type II CAAX endopeptidase family protein [candidate division KSB1 bacterium]|nr:type II CAAX endopeptidase family protein [candidate division KSB1 bacterium]